MSEDQINKLNPIAHLENWRPIPFQAFHSKLDAWIAYSGQAEFIESLRQRYTDHEMIDFVTYEQTGAPHEHIGFGKRAAEAKDRQREFLQRWL